MNFYENAFILLVPVLMWIVRMKQEPCTADPRNFSPFSPVKGLVSLLSISKARINEHVLVDAATHAVQVGRSPFRSFHQWQENRKRLLTIPWLIPPATNTQACTQCPKSQLTNTEGESKMKRDILRTRIAKTCSKRRFP